MFNTSIIALILVLMLSGLATAQKPVAQLPRVYIDTTWNPPVGGTTWPAQTAAQLSSALKAAAPGDTIVLDARLLPTLATFCLAREDESQQ